MTITTLSGTASAGVMRDTAGEFLYYAILDVVLKPATPAGNKLCPTHFEILWLARAA
jgi:hypothetical protein